MKVQHYHNLFNIHYFGQFIQAIAWFSGQKEKSERANWQIYQYAYLRKVAEKSDENEELKLHERLTQVGAQVKI